LRTSAFESSSSFSEGFRNTPRYLTWSENYAPTPFRKHLTEQVVYTVQDKEHKLFCCN